MHRVGRQVIAPAGQNLGRLSKCARVDLRPVLGRSKQIWWPPSPELQSKPGRDRETGGAPRQPTQRILASVPPPTSRGTRPSPGPHGRDPAIAVLDPIHVDSGNADAAAGRYETSERTLVGHLAVPHYGDALRALNTVGWPARESSDHTLTAVAWRPRSACVTPRARAADRRPGRR